MENLSNNIIITGFGIDNALSQILYYHLNPDSIAITCSRKNVLEAIDSVRPKFVVGFNLAYDGCPVIFYNPQLSLTHQLAIQLKCVDKNLKYAILADKLMKFDERYDFVINYYNCIGHENFVNRFKFRDDLTLTKNEMTMAKLHAYYLQQTCEEIVENESTFENGIVVCKSNYNNSYNIEGSIIEKFSETEEIRNSFSVE